MVVRLIRHLISSGTIGTTPSKRGNKPKISRNFLKLVGLHINMEQVDVHGEMSKNQIKATLTAATLDTPHQGGFSDKYVWQEVCRLFADVLVPTGIVQSEDIRWMWVTYEKMRQWYQDHKVTF